VLFEIQIKYDDDDDDYDNFVFDFSLNATEKIVILHQLHRLREYKIVANA